MRRIVYSLLILGFAVFSFAPSVYELSRMNDVQPDRKFELIHNFPTDYNFYLSRIRQGIEGRWSVVEKYTSEPHAGSLVHEMYLLMGRVGGWVRVPWDRSGDVYHIARIVLGVTLLVCIAEFAKQTLDLRFKNNDVGIKKSVFGFLHLTSYLPVFGFLLAVTASSWPKPVVVDGLWRFGGYMPWWSVVDSLQRITFIPHILAGQALIIVLALAFSQENLLKRFGNVLFLGIIGFILGMIFPPGLIFFYALMSGMLVIHIFFEKKNIRHTFYTWVVPYAGFVAVSAPSILYLFVVTSVYPWKRLAEFDTIHPLQFDYWEYVKALGPMLPLGFLGLVAAIWKKEKAMTPAVAWVGAWVGLLILFRYVPQQSPLRFTEMLPSVPLGVLTAYVAYSLVKYIQSARLVILVGIWGLIGLGMFHMYSSFLWQKDFVDHKIRASFPLVPTGTYVMYPLRDFVSAMTYIQDHYPRDAVVLSETTAGNYIPVYSGNTVYVGHDNTVFAEQKKIVVHKFFAGGMTPQEARSWLLSQHIAAIFFGPQEKSDGGIDIQKIYPFVHQVYQNAYITVFDVSNP